MSRKIIIYTDGSHKKHSKFNYIGFGAYCKYNDVKYELSGTCNKTLLKTYNISENAKISNPTAEFIGFAEVLHQLSKVLTSTSITLCFKIDYEGVKKWMSGEWKCKKTYIKKIKKKCDDIINKVGFNIEIDYVPAHSNDYGNDKADELAKNEEIFSNFNEFKLKINKQNLKRKEKSPIITRKKKRKTSIKYYAVKIGKTPGIYMSWDECKLQVHGFSGAKYKSFKLKKDAENFML